jgi:hypothetical protein
VQVSIGLTVLTLLACGLPMALQDRQETGCEAEVADANQTVYTAHRWTEADLPGIGDYLEVHYHVTIAGTPCDRGLPAPTDKSYEGLIRLRPADAGKLAAAHDWAPVVPGDEFAYGAPAGMWAELGPFAPAGPGWLHSTSYARLKSTGPLRGDLFLSTDRSTAYFVLGTS